LQKFWPHFGRWRREVGNRVHQIALVLGLIAVCLITDQTIRSAFGPWLDLLLGLCLAVFIVEFAQRLYDAGWTRRMRRYLGSMQGVADLLGAIAIPLAFLFGASVPDVWLAGALWLLKLTPAASGLSQLWRVLVAARRPLTTVATLFLMALLLGAIMLYHVERTVQSAFDSLPKSLWWAIATLTTTGYGDVVPQTAAGRLVASAMMILGIGVFGRWAGIIATGFAAESRREDFLRNLTLVRRVPFLRSLSTAALAELARTLSPLEVPAHGIIYRRGDPGDSMFFVVSGEVEIDVEPAPVRLGAGKFFGEVSMLQGRSHHATAFAVQPSTLLMLDAMDFHALTEHHPDLAKEVEAEANRRSTNSEMSPS